MTTRFRAVVEDLSTAGMEDRPGSAAVVGTTTALPLGVFRVSAWQALEGGDSLAGPYSWDVTVVPDPRGGWLVDGLRRVG